MYRICKAVLILHVSNVFCFRLLNAAEEQTFLISNDNSLLRNNSIERDYKVSDVFTEHSHEHIAVQKWRKNDVTFRKMCMKMYNKILPYALNGSQDLDLSPKCEQALIKTLIGLKQSKLWAFQMIDSSGQFPTGVLNSDVNSLGNFDECLDVNVPGLFQGQYCTLYFQLPMPERQRFIFPYTEMPEFENFTRSTSADSVIGDILRKIRFVYYENARLSICVPSTCSKEDIQKLATKVVEKTEFYADVLVDSCEILDKKYHFSDADIVIMTVLAFFVFLGITSTAVDVCIKLRAEGQNYQENLSLKTKYLLCFSFYTNTRRLLSPDNSVDSIKCFHGMRVISCLWIMLCHAYSYIDYHAMMSTMNSFNYTMSFLFQGTFQGFIVVDSFFFISAVVHSFGIMKMKDKKINFALHVFRRIIRLSIPLSFVMACVLLVPHLGSGPIWKETVERGLTEKCRWYWWANLAFINNFITRQKMCMDWLWYIPVDTQLFLLSLLVIIPMRKNPRLACAMNLLLFFGGMSISEVMQYYYGLVQLPVHGFGHKDDITYVLEKEHFQPYEHISTCCIGLLAGYFLAARKNKMNVTLKVNVTLWLTAVTLMFVVLYGALDWHRGNIPNIALCILYKSTKRVWWSLALAWITIACTTGNGGFVTEFLSWSPFVPLARLTYMVYLIHPIIQHIFIGSAKTLLQADHRTLVHMYLGNVVLSYMCGYGCALLFESPFIALQNLIFSAHIPKDNKRFKKSIAMNKGGAEEREAFLNTHANTEDESHYDKREEIGVNDYSTMGYRKLS